VLFGFDRAGWQAEFDSLADYLDEFGDRLPGELRTEQQRIATDLAGA
jgi:phosphoenolpyruvate carboxykinase (GTP)